MPLISDTEVYGSVYVQGWDSMVYTSFRTVSATKRPSLKRRKKRKRARENAVAGEVAQ